ncbi:hypothetical protein GGF46_001203 [Coemansia sp. RSA 552]|nr:hypothetical protein GGF46_001203 [Coemansia sp. RSA 552]
MVMGLFSSCFGESDDDGQYSYGRRQASGGSGSRRGGVTKAMIGAPSNFVVSRRGSLPAAKDPEKLKVLMSEVSAALDEESLFGTTPGSTRKAGGASSASSQVGLGLAC